MGLKLNLIIRLLAVAAALAAPAAGQGGAASCTASLISSFTPCFSFLTNSTNGGGGGSAPTRDCCRSLAALVNASTGCACLILTGSVPLGVPVNRTLAVSLPRACGSAAVPLQCRDTSAQIPAPGPVAGGAPSAALPPLPAATPATPEPEAPAPPVADPTGTAPVSQGQTRPAVLPSSARRASDRAPATAALVLLLALGAALV